jgi:hypothetical protein
MKQNLTQAFRQLRKLGYFAKQNLSCCTTCSWAEIPEEKAKKVVFYHNQDNSQLRSTGECYLGWAGDGKEIVKVLEDNGVKVTWDGRHTTRILININ